MAFDADSMTAYTALPDLVIGDLRINPPIVQGGMGVRVSGSRLVAAVSNEGALGTLASVVGSEELADRTQDYETRSELGLRKLIRDTRKLTRAPFAVNVMCAVTNHARLVRTAADEGVAAIVSGAGLPLQLPALVDDPHVKLIPIVSAARTADLLCRVWRRRYDRLPDAFVVEGPLAGGHLGFTLDQLAAPGEFRLERLVEEVIGVGRAHGRGAAIPVIAAGGIFDGRDIARFLRLGAAGVQLGTRFVGTLECDAALPYKEAYLRCRPEDITTIVSPVKMPARVISNGFVKRILRGEKVNFGCPYHCLTTCEPDKAGYCIAQALLKAFRGQMDDGYPMCGANAWRVNRIVPVRALLDELVAGAEAELARPGRPAESPVGTVRPLLSDPA